jgi:hypothetical protein
MVFKENRNGEAAFGGDSIYAFVDSLLHINLPRSGSYDLYTPTDIDQPLSVAVYDGCLWCCSNRRLSGIMMFQALHPNWHIRVPCRIVTALNMKFSKAYSTKCQGLGIAPSHPQHRGAWHRGQPLFLQDQWQAIPNHGYLSLMSSTLEGYSAQFHIFGFWIGLHEAPRILAQNALPNAGGHFRVQVTMLTLTLTTAPALNHNAGPSVYYLLDRMLCGSSSEASIGPVKVFMAHSRLHPASIEDAACIAALHMFQCLRRHLSITVVCQLVNPPTSRSDLSIEAVSLHYGTPLFNR